MRLLVLHPAIAARDCDHCREFLYANQHTNHVTHRKGKPVRRPAGTFAPCRYPSGCPKGTPEQPRSLNAKNVRAYRFDRECAAVGQYPDDLIVRANAATIRAVMEQLERERQQRIESRLAEIRDRR